MRRIAFLAFACALPIPLAVLAYGCDAKAPTIQDFCGFLRSEDNCYSTLIRDVGERCGVMGNAAEGVASDQWGAPKGFFNKRDMLDVCVLAEGGSITFEEALDLAAFPPKSLSFTMKDAKGATCGSFSFSGEYNFAITVAPAESVTGDVLVTGGPECEKTGTATDDTPGTDNPGGEKICGGDFIAVSPAGDFIDTTCGKEEHHFISSQLEQAACKNQKALLPRYEIDALPGDVGTPGYVRLRVLYPLPDQSPTAESIQSFAVAYFDCAIPAALKGCCNGVMDGAETDKDCGGPTVEEIGKGACDRCQFGQACISSSDCNGIVCGVDPKTGIKKCGAGMDPPGTGGMGGAGGAGGMGGTGGAGGGFTSVCDE